MNPIIHRPFQLTACRTRIKPEREVQNLFNLALLYRPSGDTHRLYEVHLPKTLQTALASPGVSSVYIEALEAGGIASILLPGEPKWLVLGVQVYDGNWLVEVPAVLKRARLHKLLLGTVTCLDGVSCLSMAPIGWLGALGLVFGSHCLRTRTEIPHMPSERTAKFSKDGF